MPLSRTEEYQRYSCFATINLSLFATVFAVILNVICSSHGAQTNSDTDKSDVQYVDAHDTDSDEKCNWNHGLDNNSGRVCRIRSFRDTVDLHSDLFVHTSSVNKASGVATKTMTSQALVLYDETKVAPIHLTKREFRLAGRKIEISQDWAALGIAAVVWEAAIVLSEYFENHKDAVQGKTVVELGAGTGLAGITVALLGGKVVITERSEAIESLTNNVQYNIPQSNDIHVQVKELDWGQDLHFWPDKYEVIIGADIIYIEETFQELLQTMNHLSDCRTDVYLASKIRYDRDTNFLQSMKEHFKVEEIFFDKRRKIHIYKANKICG